MSEFYSPLCSTPHARPSPRAGRPGGISHGSKSNGPVCMVAPINLTNPDTPMRLHANDKGPFGVPFEFAKRPARLRTPEPPTKRLSQILLSAMIPMTCRMLAGARDQSDLLNRSHAPVVVQKRLGALYGLRNVLTVQIKHGGAGAEIFLSLMQNSIRR